MKLRVLFQLFIYIAIGITSNGQVANRNMRLLYEDVIPSAQPLDIQHKQVVVQCVTSCQMRADCWSIAFKASKCRIYDKQFSEVDETWLEGKGFNYKYIQGDKTFRKAPGFKYYEKQGTPEETQIKQAKIEPSTTKSTTTTTSTTTMATTTSNVVTTVPTKPKTSRTKTKKPSKRKPSVTSIPKSQERNVLTTSQRLKTPEITSEISTIIPTTVEAVTLPPLSTTKVINQQNDVPDIVTQPPIIKRQTKAPRQKKITKEPIISTIIPTTIPTTVEESTTTPQTTLVATEIVVTESMAVTESQQPIETVTESQQPIEAVTESQQPIEAVTESQQPIEAVTESQQPIEAVTESQQPIKIVTESQQPIKIVTESQQPIETVAESQQPIETVTESQQPIETVTETPQSSTIVPESQQEPTTNQPETPPQQTAHDEAISNPVPTLDEQQIQTSTNAAATDIQQPVVVTDSQQPGVVLTESQQPVVVTESQSNTEVIETQTDASVIESSPSSFDKNEPSPETEVTVSQPNIAVTEGPITTEPQQNPVTTESIISTELPTQPNLPQTANDEPVKKEEISEPSTIPAEEQQTQSSPQQPDQSITPLSEISIPPETIKAQETSEIHSATAIQESDIVSTTVAAQITQNEVPEKHETNEVVITQFQAEITNDADVKTPIIEMKETSQPESILQTGITNDAKDKTDNPIPNVSDSTSVIEDSSPTDNIKVTTISDWIISQSDTITEEKVTANLIASTPDATESRDSSVPAASTDEINKSVNITEIPVTETTISKDESQTSIDGELSTLKPDQFTTINQDGSSIASDPSVDNTISHVENANAVTTD